MGFFEDFAVVVILAIVIIAAMFGSIYITGKWLEDDTQSRELAAINQAPQYSHDLTAHDLIYYKVGYHESDIWTYENATGLHYIAVGLKADARWNLQLSPNDYNVIVDVPISAVI